MKFVENAKNFLLLVMIVFFSMLIVATYFTFKFANSNYEGVMEKNYFEKGLNFEKEIENQKLISEQGYKIDIEKLGSKQLGEQEFILSITKNGILQKVKSVNLFLERSTTSKSNKKFLMSETNNLRYQNKININEKGIWIITFTAELDLGNFEKRTYLEIL